MNKKQRRNKKKQQQQAGTSIIRARRNTDVQSVQPRLQVDGNGEGGHTFASWMDMFGNKDCHMPPFSRDTRELDKWLLDNMLGWPWLANAANKVIDYYANRGWTITGGSRTVSLYSDLLHSFDASANGQSAGWRRGMKRMGLGYIGRCTGPFVEVGRARPSRFTRAGWRLSPATGIFNLDASKVRWVDDGVADPYPIDYSGKLIGACDFWHLLPMPLDTEEYYHLGYSPLYRCAEIIKVMCAIYKWEQGTLEPNFLDGLLLLKGFSTDQFAAAMNARTDSKSSNPAHRLGVLGVELMPGESFDLEAQLIALRSMPVSFENFEERVRLAQEECALGLGFSPSFFGITRGGSLLGRSSTETDMAERVDTSTGGNSFHLENQEKIQRLVMPETVHYQYDEAEVDESKSLDILERKTTMIRELYESENSAEGPLMTRDESRSQLAEASPDMFGGLTVAEEDETTTDMERRWQIDYAMTQPQVRKLFSRIATSHMYNDQLIRYHWCTRATGDSVLELSSQDVLIGDIAQYQLSLKSRTQPLDRTMIDVPEVRVVEHETPQLVTRQVEVTEDDEADADSLIDDVMADAVEIAEGMAE